MNLLNRQLIIATALLGIPMLSCPVAKADNTRDFYFQQVLERYYNYPTTARQLGMGGSSVATSVDSSAIVGNPAGLGFMKRGEFSGTYGHNQISGDEFPSGQSIEQTSNSGLGLLATPLGQLPNETPEFGNLGLGWSGNWSDWQDDSFGTDAKQIKVFGAYSITVSDDLSLGYSLGWNRDRLEADKLFNYPMANGFRHTVGALYKVDSNLTLASTVLVGHGSHHALFLPAAQRVSNTNQYGVGVGASYRLDATTVSAAVDYNHLNTTGDVEESIPANIIGGDEQGNIFNASIGVEQMLSDNVAVRGGYRYAGLANYDYGRSELGSLDGSAYYNAFSLGAGVVFDTDWIAIPQVKIDYGVEYRTAGYDDFQQSVTLSLPFDVCPPA